MPLTEVPSGTIAVGVDGSPTSALALAFAAAQARAERRPLTLVHAVEPMAGIWIARAGYDSGEGLGALLTHAGKLLSAARGDANHQVPALEVHEVLRVADPRELLLDVGERAAMLVVGSRGRGPVRSLLLGSVGLAVVRRAHFPVVIVRPPDQAPRHGVLVGVDGTERCAAPVEFAFQQASQRRLPLTVLHAFWDVRHAVDEDARRGPLAEDEELLLLAESIGGMREKYPDVEVHTELGRGLPDACLVSRARHMDLLVVGSRHAGVVAEALFASMASAVVERASCPVAVIPTDPRQ